VGVGFLLGVVGWGLLRAVYQAKPKTLVDWGKFFVSASGPGAAAPGSPGKTKVGVGADGDGWSGPTKLDSGLRSCEARGSVEGDLRWPENAGFLPGNSSLARFAW